MFPTFQDGSNFTGWLQRIVEPKRLFLSGDASSSVWGRYYFWRTRLQHAPRRLSTNCFEATGEISEAPSHLDRCSHCGWAVGGEAGGSNHAILLCTWTLEGHSILLFGLFATIPARTRPYSCCCLQALPLIDRGQRCWCLLADGMQEEKLVQQRPWTPKVACN